MSRRTYQFVRWILPLTCALGGVPFIFQSEKGGPGDYYLGFPLDFYVTQNDVAHAYWSPLSLLLDIIVCCAPQFAVVFILFCFIRPLSELSEES
jgi:hypothetical protein